MHTQATMSSMQADCDDATNEPPSVPHQDQHLMSSQAGLQPPRAGEVSRSFDSPPSQNALRQSERRASFANIPSSSSSSRLQTEAGSSSRESFQPDLRPLRSRMRSAGLEPRTERQLQIEDNKVDKANRKESSGMSMLDFLDSDPSQVIGPSPSTILPESATSERKVPAHIPLRIHEASAPERRASPSSRATLQPREATAGPSSLGLLHRSLSSNGTSNTMPAQTASSGEQSNNAITAWEFLNFERPHSNDAEQALVSAAVEDETKQKGKSKSKGKQRHEVPLVELRVVPTSDTLTMFGSTQTSSNYSLSGKVVVRVRNQLRGRRRSMEDEQFRERSVHDHNFAEDVRSELGGAQKPWLPEIRPDGEFLDPDDFLKTQFNEQDGANTPGTNPCKAKRICVKSLQVVFTGYAMYVDHSGRFAASKLIEVPEEVLPHGSVIDVPTTGGLQEYGVEYTLSIPGWLPASFASRFGGTFYSLEAKAKYCAVNNEEEQLAIPSSLLPPRRGSRVQLEDSPEGRSALDEVRDSSWDQDVQRRSGDSPTQSVHFARLPKARCESLPPSANDESNAKEKESWLSKKAKRLSVLAKTNNQSSNLTASPSASGSNTPQPMSASSSSEVIGPKITHQPKLAASKGYLRAFSDPIVIVVYRCREVVPVPVARLAIVGPEGTPAGVAQDPPQTRNQQTNSTLLQLPDTTSPLARPSALNAPGDPSKSAAHIAGQNPPNAPLRSSSVPQDLASQGLPAPGDGGEAYVPPPPIEPGSSVPMRHFLHRPQLHPPADSGIVLGSEGLPFSLTLSLPSYVATAGTGSEVLTFAVQIEVGRSLHWASIREGGGLRLREMELSCTQTERHCSVPSRNYSHMYPMPPQPEIGPLDLPVFGQPTTVTALGRRMSSSEQRLRRGYDPDLVNRHISLWQREQACDPNDNYVERVRTVIVGPPPQPQQYPSKSQAQPGTALPRSNSVPQGTSVLADQRTPSSQVDTEADVFRAPSAANGGGSRRGRRAYQSALRGLSSLATAVMDMSNDNEGPNQRIPGVSRPDLGLQTTRQKTPPDDQDRSALYTFSGSDGHGVDLTRGRIRMAIKLPLVSSRASRARAAGHPALMADFESPYTKVRHKLQVKLGFGFGNKPLGGGGKWGQSLVMCVPVRFTDAAPKEVREQFAPMPIQHIALSSNSDSADLDPAGVSQPGGDAATAALGSITPGRAVLNGTPILPSYNQLFREDGSRLADDGEDLPQYPGPRNRLSHHGSVSDSAAALAQSGADDAEAAGLDSSQHAEAGASMSSSDESASHGRDRVDEDGHSPVRRRANTLLAQGERIAPVKVLDESIPLGMSAEVGRHQEQEELARMQNGSSIDSGTADQADKGKGETSSTLRIPLLQEQLASDDQFADTDSDGGANRRTILHNPPQAQQMSAEIEQRDYPIASTDECTQETSSGHAAAPEMEGEMVDVDTVDVFREDTGDDVPQFAAPRPASDEQ